MRENGRVVGPVTRKLPSHRALGSFSYSRVPLGDGEAVYRLFRRDQSGRLHCEMRVFHPDYPRRLMAQDLNRARHQLRDQVDEVDLKLMGVTQ